MEALVIGIMMDLVFFARFLYIKKHFYKTKGVANGNGYKYQYASEFIYGYKGHNYVCRVKKIYFRCIMKGVLFIPYVLTKIIHIMELWEMNRPYI